MITVGKLEKIKEKEIIEIWENYINQGKVIKDTKGNFIDTIDDKRKDAIIDIEKMIKNYWDNGIDIIEFKIMLDSYNKRNNLWGFTSIKGQMFFNQLVKTNLDNIESLSKLLKECIHMPKDIIEAKEKIDKLDEFVQKIYNNVKDKRTSPKPSSVGYFLSYFWQIIDHTKWPVMYTSLIYAFIEMNIWEDKEKNSSSYEYFYNLNNEIRKILEKSNSKKMSNWEIEHAFWNYSDLNKENKVKNGKEKQKLQLIDNTEINVEVEIKANFNINEFLIPKVSKLEELGADTKKTPTAKGNEYEKLVAEIFKQLDFEVDILGQGTGRNPDAIIKLREKNTAFLVDAKAYADGYVMGTDDRAIREYINRYCIDLQKEGYNKIGFIIVSNSFRGNMTSFINEITWNTDIKRFLLITSRALLYLLAYKTKNRIEIANVVDSIIGFNNPIKIEDVIAHFDDI